jgi:hypothetical protein
MPGPELVPIGVHHDYRKHRREQVALRLNRRAATFSTSHRLREVRLAYLQLWFR